MTAKDIREKREALGLSQKELASLVGVGKNTIYNYENGGTIPKGKIPILERVLNPNNVIEKKEDQEKTPLKDARFEDIIAERLFEKLKPLIQDRFADLISEKAAEKLTPFIQKKTDDLLRVIGDMQLDFMEIRVTQDEIKEIQKQTKEEVEKLQ